MIFDNKRYILSISLTILMVFCTHISGYADITPVKDRTPQIRDAIVAAVPGVNTADDVTAAHLAAITTLNPAFRGITSLKSGDFNGLTALTHLNLSGNAIGDISVLEGLTTLTSLYLAATAISDISALENLTALKNLYLTHNSISDISALENLTALTELSLGENSVSNISVLKGLTALKTLILDNNSISDVSVLENLTTLKFLYLNKNPISDYGPLRRLIAAIAGIENHPGLTLDIVIPTNNAPVFTDGSSTTLAVAENTASGQNIGAAVAATDADSGDTLTYSLGGTDAASFSIDDTTGQLQTSAALDFETKASYSVTVDVSDSKGGSDAIDVTINVTDVNEAPVFTQGTRATLAVAEHTASGTNIGVAFTATDPDSGDTLTYSLRRSDRNSFSVDPNTGQLRTRAALDYETKRAYTNLAVRVTDSGGLTDAIILTINVTDVNENRSPVFTDGNSATRAVAENTASGENIGSAVSATDPDNDTLTYTLSGADAASFSINGTNGQLKTSAALDYEAKTSYSVRITVSDSELTDTIDVTINITDVDENRAPAFTDGSSTTRSVAENTALDTNIGSAVAATDPDDDTLTYTLSGADAASFSINGTNGQLKTKAALDYEAKSSYTVRITVSDSKLTDTIDVTINITDVNENRAPVFTDGSSTTRAVTENTGTGQNIGSAIAATDADTDDTLTYTLGGADAASFSINGTNGQLKTSAALDYETKSSYSVSITVSDSKLTDTIDVTINVTNVNEAPSFATITATRSIAENTAADTNIGAAFTATDVDANTTLTYTLGGTDAASFRIDGINGQLQTSAALDYETKISYSVTITVSDSKLTDTIDVTINIIDVDENRAPSFAEGTSTTRAVAENTAADTNIGDPVSATDPDNDTLTYTLGGADAASFRIDNTNGQLRTDAALDYETKPSYSVTVSVSDGNGSSQNITVTINVTDVNDTYPLYGRTRQVQNAIVTAVPDVYNADEVTPAHLAAITELDLSYKDITSLKSGDFSGLPALTELKLSGNSISDISALAGLTTLTTLKLDYNAITDISSLRGLTSLKTLYLARDNSITDISPLENMTDLIKLTLGENFVKDISPVKNMTKLKELYLESNSISDISPLKNMTSLKWIKLDNNSITDISPLKNLTNLENLYLSSNSVEDISPLENLTSLVGLYLYSNSVEDISPLENLTNLQGLGLAFNSISDMSLLENLTSLVGLSLKGNPISDYGPLRRLQRLKAANSDLFLIDIGLNNNPPQFTEGNSTTRTIAENIAAGINIGEAVTATDADDHTLTYSLSGTDAESFSINSRSGQLKTKETLDYETKASYTVTVTVYDGNSGGDRITVTIGIIDAVDEDGRAAPSIETSPIIPNRTALLTNFPNPFNPETWIPYQLANPAEVTLTIYDIRGVAVRELQLGHQPAGIYSQSEPCEFHWDGRNAFGEKVATGIYFLHPHRRRFHRHAQAADTEIVFSTIFSSISPNPVGAVSNRTGYR